MTMVRKPAVAGYFYPADAAHLRRDLDSYLQSPDRQQETDATAVVVPHAGYMYSGEVAGAVYASVRLPDTFIILCPNHTGFGSDFDLDPSDQWVTPLGAVTVDAQLSAELQSLFPHAQADGRAHLREHSLEVQLPFLQHLKGDIRFVPLCIRQLRYEYLEQLGNAIAEIIRKSGRDILIVASSDMTHYETQQKAMEKDKLAIEKMQQLEPSGLYETVHRYDISMCGYLPATTALIAARRLGSIEGKLIKYATSGDVSGDYQQVVGYAGMVFPKS